MNNDNQPRFGFVNFAETWNGRMAMMGILIGLGTELITGQSFLDKLELVNILLYFFCFHFNGTFTRFFI